ncbi:uncharacterized protein LOC119685789 [Teleopsis dalmanni]|uniref:uncharacterized protein LOC119685789 n=1 Tax=Teleopsis dalmanni TaxID=139649 RepID=UPI0018CD119E|nr:uncharacterized protein LOC119685789 [Teleopsis dalmanni]
MEHLRIVVQLNDSVVEIKNTKDGAAENGDSSSNSNNLQAKVYLIDFSNIRLDLNQTTDNLTISSHKMNFDLVSFASDESLLKEVNQLMDQLLLQRRDCSLIRFAAKREWRLTFLYNALIEEVNNRLERLKATVHFVRVDYREIMKNGVRDLLHDLQEEDCFADSCKEIANPNDSHISCCKDKFRSTRELLLWLLNEHRHKWNTASGHEFLELKFFIVDDEHRTFKIKFTLFNLYLDQMDNEERGKLNDYIEQLGGGIDFAFEHSPLTSFLSGHLEATTSTSGRTLLLYDVPVNEDNATVDLLQIADSLMKSRSKGNLNLIKRIFQNRNKENMHTKNENSIKDKEVAEDTSVIVSESKEKESENSEKDSEHKNKTNKDSNAENKEHLNKPEPIKNDEAAKVKNPLLESTENLREEIEDKHKQNNKQFKNMNKQLIPSKTNNRDDNENSEHSEYSEHKETVDSNKASPTSEKDFNCLSFWYRKIDDKYTQARDAVQAFFEKFDEVRVTQICDDVKMMSNSIDNFTKDSVGEENTDPVGCKNDDIKTFYKNYEASLLAFKAVSDDVKYSQFVDYLEIYMETRNFELSEAIVKFKTKQLSSLLDVVQTELNALKSLEDE